MLDHDTTTDPDFDQMLRGALSFIRERGPATFAELATSVPDFSGGDWVLASEAAPNLEIVLWAGMSDRGLRVAQALLDRPDIEVRGVNPMLYAFEGGGLNLPVLTPGMLKTKNRKKLKTVWDPVSLAAKHPEQRGYR